MKTEICPNCGKVVEGSYAPSNTRKILTSIAKEGGMKALGWYVGWVLPGLGPVVGFVGGVAIDLIYGTRVNQLIDKIADILEKRKIYAFSCPKCGKAWTRSNKEDKEEFYKYLCKDRAKLESLVEERKKQIDGCLEAAKKYEIHSDEFKKYALIGLGIAKEMRRITEELMFSDKFGLSNDDLFDEVSAYSEALCGAASDFLGYMVKNSTRIAHRGSTYQLNDYSKSFSMEVYGAYPGIYTEGLMLFGKVLTGKVRKNDRIVLPNNEEVSIKFIDFNGSSEGTYIAAEEANVGDICAITVETNSNFGDKRFVIEAPR